MEVEQSKKRDCLQKCKCCLEETGLKDLWSPNDDGECEKYGDMLTECFALSWEEPSDINSEYICRNCISRLKAAVKFKKEILYSEQMLLLKIEQETFENTKQDTELEDEVTTEYLELEEDNFTQETTTIKIEPIENPEVVKKKYKNYTDEDLQKCVDAVLKNKMSQNKASITFNVSRSAISRALAKLERAKKPKKKVAPELQKSQENLDYILKYSNATPFKGFFGNGYTCFLCPKKFEEPFKLKSHTLKHLRNKKLSVVIPIGQCVKLDLSDLECNVCVLKIDSLESLLEHLKVKHGESIHTFDGEKSENYLVPFKFESDVLSCVVCCEDFLTFKLLYDHMNCKHYSNYECVECGRGFISQISWRTHALRHKTGVFECTFCVKVFTSRDRCNAHERSVHLLKHKRYKCGYCDEKFVDIVKKHEHEVEVHNAVKKLFECGTCHRKYKSVKNLRFHIEDYHLLNRPHKCSVCEFSAKKSTELKNHILKHTRVKGYKCDVCSKSYVRKTTLREHLRIHANDRRFKCEECGQRFVQKCSWRAHMRVKHGDKYK